MAARQRLKVILEARRASQRCWRCTLDLPRCHSTSSAIRLDSSKSTDTVSYDQVLQQEIEKTLEAFFANRLEAAPRTLHKTESGTTYAEKPFRGRVEDGGQMAVVSRSKSQSTAIAQQLRQQNTPSDQPVTQGSSLQTPSSLGEADQKLIIRKWAIDRPASSSRLLVKDCRGHGVNAGRISPAIRKTYGKKGGFMLVPPDVNGTSTSTKDENKSRPVKETQQSSECQPDVRGSKELIAENSEAHVKLSEEPLIKKYIFGNGALYIPKISESGKSLRFIRKLQHDLPWAKEFGCPTDANEVPMEGQREDEAFYDAIASLLDLYRDIHPPKTPPASERFEKSVSSARFSPQNSSIRRAAIPMSRRHAWDRQSLDTFKTLYSTSTNPTRLKAKTTVSKEDWCSIVSTKAFSQSQTVQADMKLDPTITTENPDEPIKWKSTGISEYLRSWQEQHETALVDTAGRPSSGPLSEGQNLFTQSGEDDSFTTIATDDEVDDEFEMGLTSDEPSQDIFTRSVFLRRGDLVELT